MAGSTCSACGAQYPQIKTQCPSCGAAIETVEAFVLPPTPTVSGHTALLIMGLTIVCGLLLYFTSCSRDTDTVREQTPVASSVKSAAVDQRAARIAYIFMNDETKTVESRKQYAEQVVREMPGTQEAMEAQSLLQKIAASPDSFVQKGSWEYIDTQDELSRETVKAAQLESIDSFTLDFPYGGEQRATLMLSNHPTKGRNAALFIERGQILCNSYTDCTIALAFDDKKPRSVQGLEPASHESTMVFIPQPKRFMDDVAGARELRVGFKLYNQPPQVVTFNVAGLDREKLKL